MSSLFLVWHFLVQHHERILNEAKKRVRSFGLDSHSSSSTLEMLFLLIIQIIFYFLFFFFNQSPKHHLNILTLHYVYF